MFVSLYEQFCPPQIGLGWRLIRGLSFATLEALSNNATYGCGTW